MNTDTTTETGTDAEPTPEVTHEAVTEVESARGGIGDVVADPATVQQLDPRDLVMDANVRHTAEVDRAFVATIRDHGVLQPIYAVLTDDGRARVRFGHRRTLAAITAELTTVPVIVHPNVDTADAAEAREEEIERIATQTVENTQREGLTQAEQLDVFSQLSALGLSAGQIAKHTKAKRRDVVDGLKAARTDEVRDAVASGLTLEQGAVLDEFTDDPKAYEALLDKAHGGGHSWDSFAHLTQQFRDARDDRETREAITAELTAAGVPIVEAAYTWDDPTTRLSELTDDPAPQPDTETADETADEAGDEVSGGEDGWDPDEDEDPEDEVSWEEEDPDEVDRQVAAAQAAPDLPAPITPEAHAACPGHAAQIGGFSRRVQAVYVCTDPLRYGHRARSAYRQLRPAKAHAPQPGESTEQAAAREEAARAEAKAARAQVIAGNRAWIAAETVRREFIATLVARKTPPKGAAGFVAGVVLHDGYSLSRAVEKGHDLAAELLSTATGYIPPSGRDRIAKALDGASEPRAQVITLAMALAAVEAGTGKHSWRQERRIGGPDASLVRYLRFLSDACHYPLSGIERWAIGEDIDADAVFAPVAGPDVTDPDSDPGGESDEDSDAAE